MSISSRADPQRPDGALEHRRVGDVELELLGGHQPSGLARFFAAFLAEIDVGPAGEPVLLVPGALTVSQQDESKHAVLYDCAVRRGQLADGRPAGVARRRAELFFDAQQLVVLRDRGRCGWRSRS